MKTALGDVGFESATTNVRKETNVEKAVKKQQ